MKKRNIYDNVKKQKDSNKISIIIGARQVGKTTLLKRLHKELGGVFFDLDVFSNFEKVDSYENCINTLKLSGYDIKQKESFYLFLDEFQRYSDISKIMKNIYDHHDNIKIFASGSSSLSIKNKLQESLAGRKIINYMYPLNFSEFLHFKGANEFLESIHLMKNIQSANYFALLPNLQLLFEEFLIFGGYPEVVLSRTKDKKIQAIESIFDLFISKDLVDYLQIDKIKQAKILIEKLAICHGGIVNYASLSVDTELNEKTVKNYIEILKESFLINILKPYYSNKNKEISKSPKIYFLDNGVRNYFINNFNPTHKRTDIGLLFESYYISELIKYGNKPESLKYYRTKSGTEVDVIIDLLSSIIPIELKYNNRSINKNDLMNMQTFMKNYITKNGLLINIRETGITKGNIGLFHCFHLPKI